MRSSADAHPIQNHESQAAAVRPRGRERLWVLLLMGGFLAFSLATFNYYPAVWCDEVLYSEPAINLIRHGSYTTDAYEFQPPDTFPIVNCPLYGQWRRGWR